MSKLNATKAHQLLQKYANKTSVGKTRYNEFVKLSMEMASLNASIKKIMDVPTKDASERMYADFDQ